MYVRDSSSSDAKVLLRVMISFTMSPKTTCSSALASQPLPICTWLEASGSQVVGKSACYKWPSWISRIKAFGLINPQDPFTVAVIKDGCVVGHILRTVCRIVSLFLGKDRSVGFCEVTGAMVNRTAGFGLEIPCVYRFYGRLAYI